MRQLLAALAGVIVVAAFSSARAAQTSIPPSPTTLVTDNAALLSPSARDALEARLAAYNQATGHQVIVWIGTTTGVVPLEDWTIRAFTAWKVGRKGLDDGLALFIFTRDHKMRIEVGYGLESRVTDAVASRIEHEQIVPRLRAGDGDGAVSAGVEALLAAIGGVEGPQAPQTDQAAASASSGLTLWEILFGFIAIVLLLSLITRSPGLAGWLLYSIASGGRGNGYSGGGSWGGGGGFSGGGGMGGGGGASASW